MSDLKRFSRFVVAGLTLLATVSLNSQNPLSAQVLYGSLTGNVTDASGASVPGAKVEALNVATGIAKTGHDR